MADEALSPTAGPSSGRSRRRPREDEIEHPRRPGTSRPSIQEASTSRGRDYISIVTRPAGFDKKGREGSKIALQSNYFELVRKNEEHLIQYRVDFTPEIEHKGLRFALVRVHEALIGKYTFDGEHLFCPKRLPQPFELMSEKRSDNNPVTIKFKLTRELHKGDAEHTRVMNIIFHRCLKMLNLTLIKREFYDSSAAVPIDSLNLKLWPGYRTSIRHHEDGLLLGVEIIHKLLRNDTALDVAMKVYRKAKAEGQTDFLPRIKAALEGKIVMTHYNKKTYRIDDIDQERDPMSTFFSKKEGREITFVEYYKSRYDIEITDMRQKLLVSRPSRRDLNRGDSLPIYLVPELCGMTGLDFSDDKRRNDLIKRDLASRARVNPGERIRRLLEFRKRLNIPEVQRELGNWQLTIANDLVNVPARILPTANILHGAGVRTSAQRGDWNPSLKHNKHFVAVGMKTWIIFYPQELDRTVRTFVVSLQTVGNPQNFAISQPIYVPMNSSRNNDYIREIRAKCDRDDLSMIMAIVNSKAADVYNSIKRVTLTELGIPSQVLTRDVIRRDDLSVATKVAIQVATKIGAEPWHIDSFIQNDWMICGYDCYEDHKQGKTVGAFVASTNSSFTSYYSITQPHEGGSKFAPSFESHVYEALKAYYKKDNKKTLPSKIIIYRDGVSAGDIATLKEGEIKSIEEAIIAAKKQFDLDSYNPGLAFIIVNKKINTRFFHKMQHNRVENPPCGTVVDGTVTLRERYDFFLVPQKTNQGTVSPTAFNVIVDTTDLGPDNQQKLANAMTHLYFNWPGPLRVPAQIQYAHKLAYLAGENLNGVKPKLELSNQLYYL